MCIRDSVYIDDYNAIEIINLKNAPTHITTRKTAINVRAKKSERLFGRLNNLASEIGMKVNGKKTQLLCINPCVHNSVHSYIRHEGERIESAEELKILGFTFDHRPNANRHVETIIEKFYRKLWVLRFLKKSGLDNDRLLQMYYSVVRSAVEYCSVVYHTMIPKYLADTLEGLQRRALRIIFGFEVDINELMAAKGIDTLEERREAAVLKFALKKRIY